MMLAESVKKLIQHNAKNMNIAPQLVYAYSIDPNIEVNSVKNPIIRISEIDNTPHNYGSNYSQTMTADIQIQIFIPHNFTGDTSVIWNKLDKIMEHRQWYCSLNQGIKRDPTANVLCNTTHWRKNYKK